MHRIRCNSSTNGGRFFYAQTEKLLYLCVCFGLIFPKAKHMMNKYQYLLELQQSGTLKTLLKEFSFPTHFISWMEIYKYHLEHPKLSHFQIALHFNTSKAKVWEVYHFMNQPLRL